jgi:TonB-dependent SusC/RagA subfamily outer membrane receptor
MTRIAVLVIALVGAVVSKAPAQGRLSRSDSGTQSRPAEGFSQDQVRSPLLRLANLDVSGVPIGEGLNKLFRQSGVAIAYRSDVVPASRRVTCHCNRLTVGRALSIMLAGLGLQVSELDGATLLISPKEADDAGNGDEYAGPLTVGIAPANFEALVSTVTGRVTDAKSGKAIQGAQVQVRGTSLGSVTGPDGRFRIAGVPDGAIAVQVKAIGYVPSERQASVATGVTLSLDFQLAEQALLLDQVVVTGSPNAARKREVGNSISQITMAKVVTPNANVDNLLQGRAVGMNVQEGNASAGSGSQIRLRGNVSVGLSNQPLVYVDGVRIRSDGYPTRLGGRVNASPLNDLNAADIERIEIIKGPAATTLYGTEAAAGVIQILTKRGAEGKTAWTFQMDQGFDKVRPFGIPENPYVWMKPWLLNGHRQNYNVSANGGGKDLRFFVSAGYENHQFVMKNDWEKKLGLRGNFAFNLLPKLNVEVNSMYSNHDISNTPSGNNSAGLGVNVFRYDRNQFGKFDKTLIDQVFQNEIYTYVDRLIQGTTFTYTPRDFFTNRLTIGYDRAVTDGRDLRPYGFFASPTGLLVSRVWTGQNLSYDYVGTLRGKLFGDLNTAFSFGGQSTTAREDAIQGQSENFPGAEVPTLSNGSIRNVIETRTKVVNLGGFVQNVFDYKDRYFLTLGLRVDGNSTFGSNLGLQSYPKVSMSYVISDEPFWPKAWGQLKLRGAYGHAGRAPGAFDASRTWAQVGFGGRPAFSTGNVGNPDLGPERTAETELGFDAAILHERLTADFTYFRRRTTDALFSVLQAPSLGFPAPQLSNVGELKSSGIELALNANVIQSRNFSWDLGLNVATLKSLLVSLGGASPFGDASGGSGFYYEGQPFPVIKDKRLRNPNEIADPDFEFDHFYGPNQPTHTITGLTTVVLPGGISLTARGEYLGGHYIADNASTGGYRRGVPWPLCTNAYTLMQENRRNEMTAFERAWCVQSNVSGTDIYPADFFKLREATVRLPLGLVSHRLNNATFTVSARNWFTWKNKDFKIMDPEATNDIGVLANVRSITEAIPPAASITSSLRITF